MVLSCSSCCCCSSDTSFTICFAKDCDISIDVEDKEAVVGEMRDVISAPGPSAGLLGPALRSICAHGVRHGGRPPRRAAVVQGLRSAREWGLLHGRGPS